MSTYNSQYFIDKLAQIPEKNWTVALLENHDGTKGCTIKWLGGYESADTVAMSRMFLKHFAKNIDDVSVWEELKELPHTILYMVNDCSNFWNIKVKGSHPKERILNTLYQIRKKELQDGNIALAKQIVANPKSVSDAQKATNKPKPRCFSNSY